jgi:hypothetical protein
MPQDHPVGTGVTRLLVRAGAAAPATARPPSFQRARLQVPTFLAARGESDRRGAAQVEDHVEFSHH